MVNFAVASNSNWSNRVRKTAIQNRLSCARESHRLSQRPAPSSFGAPRPNGGRAESLREWDRGLLELEERLRIKRERRLTELRVEAGMTVPTLRPSSLGGTPCGRGSRCSERTTLKRHDSAPLAHGIEAVEEEPAESSGSGRSEPEPSQAPPPTKAQAHFSSRHSARHSARPEEQKELQRQKSGFLQRQRSGFLQRQRSSFLQRQRSELTKRQGSSKLVAEGADATKKGAEAVPDEDLTEACGENQRRQRKFAARGSELLVPPTFLGVRSTCLIEPNTPWKLKWDVWIAGLIMYSILLVPYRVGFGVKLCLFSSGWTFDLIADACFMVDIILTFRTAIVVEAGAKNTETIERDTKVLAINYLRGWFTIDLASTVPIDTIIDLVVYFSDDGATECGHDSSANGGSSGIDTSAVRLLRILRLVRLLKLFRFLKLGRFIKKFEDDVNMNPAIIRFTTILTKIFFLAHLVGCFWFGIHTFAENQNNNWVKGYAEDQLTPELRDEVEGDDFTQYVVAVYWAFTTMTTVGYGDVLPKNTVELLFVTAMEMVGIVVFGIVIGSITHIASNFNLKRKLANDRMQIVNRYVRERGLNKLLQRRIRRFYEYYFDRVSVFDIEGMLEEVSTSLKNEMCVQIYKDLIADLPFLHSRDPSFISHICVHLQPFFALEGEYICRRGVISMEMYWIRKGQLKIIPNRKNPMSALLVAGESFGQAALLANERLKCDVLADEYSDLLHTSRDKIFQICADYPTLKDELIKSDAYRTAMLRASGASIRQTRLSSTAAPASRKSGLAVVDEVTTISLHADGPAVPPPSPPSLSEPDMGGLIVPSSSPPPSPPRDSCVPTGGRSMQNVNSAPNGSRRSSSICSPLYRAFRRESSAVDCANPTFKPNQFRRIPSAWSFRSSGASQNSGSPADAASPPSRARKLWLRLKGRKWEVDADSRDRDGTYFDSPFSAGKAALEVTECRRLRLIHPSHPLKITWDLILAFFVLYSIITVPLRIGFNLYAPADSIIFWFDIFIDFFFALDVIVNFRSAIYRDTGELELNSSVIARKYLASWFVIDFSASIPIDLILFLVESSGSDEFKLAKLLKGLRLFRLMKLLRLLKISKYLKNVQEEVQVNPAIIELWVLGIQTLFLVHFAGCLWHWTAIINLPDAEPARTEEALNTWLVYYIDRIEVSNWPSVGERYVASIYWALTTMSTIGYGDIVAVTNSERMVSILVMLAGSVVFGIVVGGMTNMIDQLDSHHTRAQERLDVVKAMLRDRKVGTDLVKKTKLYYDYYLYESSDAGVENMILDELCPPLRTEVLMFLNAALVEKIDFFRGMEPTFIVSVCKLLKPCCASPGDLVFREGELGHEMFFLQSGMITVLCHIKGEEFVLDHQGPGTYFGEVAVLIEGRRREVSAQAVSFCSMYSLSSDSLNELLYLYPEVKQSMQEKMQRRLIRWKLKRAGSEMITRRKFVAMLTPTERPKEGVVEAVKSTIVQTGEIFKRTIGTGRRSSCEPFSRRTPSRMSTESVDAMKRRGMQSRGSCPEKSTSTKDRNSMPSSHNDAGSAEKEAAPIKTRRSRSVLGLFCGGGARVGVNMPAPAPTAAPAPAAVLPQPLPPPPDLIEQTLELVRDRVTGEAHCSRNAREQRRGSVVRQVKPCQVAPPRPPRSGVVQPGRR